jgi:hypothetical protein
MLLTGLQAARSRIRGSIAGRDKTACCSVLQEVQTAAGSLLAPYSTGFGASFREAKWPWTEAGNSLSSHTEV